jgi:nitrile hydratase
MGGRTEFFGPVIRDLDEPTFHEPWEARVFGMSFFLLPLLGHNFDIVRFAIEKLPRDVYLSSYYRRWLGAFENLLVDAEYLAQGEVDARMAGSAGPKGRRHVPRAGAAVISRLLRGMARPEFPRWIAGQALPRLLGTSRPTLRGSRFAVGDRVRVREYQAEPFTRQPGYVTGKAGEIVAHHGATLFPDAVVVRRRATPQHLYTVAFEGTELWGADAEPDTEVLVELFESYLEAA